MTLYGEQEGGRVDEALHLDNRAAWNAWACQNLNDEEAAKYAALAKVDVAETRNWDARKVEITKLHREVTKSRSIGSKSHYKGLPDVNEKVDFSKLHLLKTVVMKRCIFTQTAYFRDSTFEGDAYYGRATFKSLADFRDVRFMKDAYFRGGNFIESAVFMSAVFHGFARFERAKFGDGYPAQNPNSNPASHSSEVGPLKYDFTDCDFAKSTSFREAKFHATYPILDGAVLHQNTDFSAEEAYWPVKTAQKPAQARESCATIRHAIAKQGLPEEEHFFFRREMEFARQVEWADKDAGWLRFKAWPYLLFKVFSNYGESIARPVRALCELFVLGAGALFGFYSAMLGFWQAAGLAAAVSFSNLLPLFGFGRTFLKDDLEMLPSGLQFVSGAQTVLALPLLFFLGLALRKRFRLR